MIRTAALTYAARGWRVLPIEPAGKRPLNPTGCNGASADPELVRQWFDRWPDANIGIATGAGSNLVVLDVDTSDEKHGDRTLVELVARHGGIGDVPHVLTGSGGSHFYFSAPPGVPVPCSASRVGPGLDVRGNGGYVVAPPSIHACGERYSWFAGGTLAPPPGWLLALMLPPAPRIAERPPGPRPPRVDVVVRASCYLARMDAAVSGSGGSNATYAAAVALVCGFGLDTADALDLLVHEYNPRCKPAWTLDELRHKVESADAAARVGRGYLLDRMRVVRA